MTDNIIEFPGMTKLDVPVKKVIDGAVKADLDAVIIIGRTKSGEPYYASSVGNEAQILWQIEQFKRMLLLPTKKE